MRPPGTPGELERRRRTAINLLDTGHGVRETARLVGASASSVSRWQAAWRSRGEDGLRPQPPPEPQPRLTADQRRRLAELLLAGAAAHGHPNELWTLRRVRALIERRFGVAYGLTQVWRILRALGFSPQKPRQLARERDEAAVKHWRERTWPALQKKRAPRAAASSSATRPGSCSSRSPAAPGRRAGGRRCSAAGTGTTAGA
jgi:transposase